MMQRPAYAVDSIDHTLAALELLTQREAMRLSDLADELGIGRATAHRLLRMLVYRGFALQKPDRSYAAGPSLTAARQRARTQNLRSWLSPSLRLAHDRLDESVQLQVLSGADVVTVESIERPGTERQLLRGARLPAERSAGGLVLLAQLPASETRARFAHLPQRSLAQLDRALTTTRRQGFGHTAETPGTAGTDAVSVSVPVFDHDGRPAAALTCTAPSARLLRPRAAEAIAVLRAVVPGGTGPARPARRSRPTAGSAPGTSATSTRTTTSSCATGSKT
jgi:IclR family transcriptional regulator, acetate operon repressor